MHGICFKIIQKVRKWCTILPTADNYLHSILLYIFENFHDVKVKKDTEMRMHMAYEKVTLEHDVKLFCLQTITPSCPSSTSIGDLPSNFREKVKAIRFPPISCYQTKKLPAYAPFQFPSLTCYANQRICCFSNLKLGLSNMYWILLLPSFLGTSLIFPFFSLLNSSLNWIPLVNI